MAEWKSGQVILGEYAIEKELGRGGMGRVWLVKSQSTGRRFAVKQTLLKEDKHRKAFLAELQTWIDLPEHPNIVPCRFFRTVGDEIVIFADYIEGGSLADWIAKGKLTGLEQIFDVAIQFAWGLHAIHERGLIHQDVKPGNVLMTPEGVPMVTDFGLARARLRASDGAFVSPALPRGPGQQSVMVSSGGMTPAYASPEQRNGKPLSRKTDIWSWGVSVLDMFMGGVSCPHGGHIAAEVLGAFIENGQNEECLPEMPDEVASVLRKCLQREPQTRFATIADAASALIAAYARCTGGDYPRSAPPLTDTTLPAPRQPARRHSEWPDPRRALDSALRLAGKNWLERRRVCKSGPLRRTPVADMAVYEEALRILEHLSPHQNTKAGRIFATVCLQKAAVHSFLGDDPGALRLHDSAIDLWTTIVRATDDWRDMQQLALAYNGKIQVLESVRAYEDAVLVCDKLVAIWHMIVVEKGRVDQTRHLATALQNAAAIRVNIGDTANALDFADKAILTIEVVSSRNVNKDADFARRMASVYATKATVLTRMQDYQGSLEFYDRTIEALGVLIRRGRDTEVEKDLIGHRLNKTIALLSLRRWVEAGTECDAAIASIRRFIAVIEDLQLQGELARALSLRASAYEAAGDRIQAVALYGEAIRIRDNLVGMRGQTHLLEALDRTCRQRSGVAMPPIADYGNMSGTDTQKARRE